MDLNIIQIILVLIVAFLAGMEGILDEFQFHQPIIACTLIGLVTGELSTMSYLRWYSSNDCFRLGKYRSCRSTGCCVSISCICNYFSFKWTRYKQEYLLQSRLLFRLQLQVYY